MRPSTCFQIGTLMLAMLWWAAAPLDDVSSRLKLDRTTGLPAGQPPIISAQPGGFEQCATEVAAAPVSKPLVLWSTRHWDLLLCLNRPNRRLHGEDWPQPFWRGAETQEDLCFTGARGDTIAPLLHAHAPAPAYYECTAMTGRGAVGQTARRKSFGVYTRRGFVSF